MKKPIVLLMMAFCSSMMYGQDITGQWNGVLKVYGSQLRLIFHVTKTDSGYTSTMDSPDQGKNGIPTSSTTFQGDTLKAGISKAGIEYVGVLDKNNIITGNFKQGGRTFPMNLSRDTIAEKKLIRPQEPVKPYPYYSEDLTFENKSAGIELAGTLALPKKEGVFPVVVMISGSGANDRNEEMLGHKPFLVISDYLTRNGIAVLRYDDRGTHQSEGDFSKATSLDFASDVEAAVAYLKTRKEINKKEIGLIGHSEGGLIAPMVASKSKDIAFIVLLAGPGIPVDQLLVLQSYLVGKASGMSDKDLAKAEILNRGIYEIVKKSTNTDQLKTDLTNYFKKEIKKDTLVKMRAGETEDEFIKSKVDAISTPWLQYFLKYDPSPALEKVKCPVLALNGSKDLQVPPKEDLKGIKEALAKGGNKNVTTIELPNLNHLFQECTTGSPDEYGTIEQTFSPTALTEILKWIKMQIK